VSEAFREEADRVVLRPLADRNRVGRRMVVLGLVMGGAVAALAWKYHPQMLFLAFTPGFVVLYGLAMAIAGRNVVVDGRKRLVHAPGARPLPFGEVAAVRLASRVQVLRAPSARQEIRWWRLELQPRGGDAVTLLELVDRDRVRRAGERVASLLERPLDG
jgi:hypothetical protein